MVLGHGIQADQDRPRNQWLRFRGDGTTSDVEPFGAETGSCPSLSQCFWENLTGKPTELFHYIVSENITFAYIESFCKFQDFRNVS